MGESERCAHQQRNPDKEGRHDRHLKPDDQDQSRVFSDQELRPRKWFRQDRVDGSPIDLFVDQTDADKDGNRHGKQPNRRKREVLHDPLPFDIRKRRQGDAKEHRRQCKKQKSV
jgi:hypothetical protein